MFSCSSEVLQNLRCNWKVSPPWSPRCAALCPLKDILELWHLSHHRVAKAKGYLAVPHSSQVAFHS